MTLEAIFKFWLLSPEVLLSISNLLLCYWLLNIKESSYLTCNVTWSGIFCRFLILGNLRLDRGLFFIFFLDKIVEIISATTHICRRIERFRLAYLLGCLFLMRFEYGFLPQLVEMFLKVKILSIRFFPLSLWLSFRF